MLQACILSSDKSASVQIGDATTTGFQYSDDIGHVVAAYTSGDIKDLRFVKNSHIHRR